MATSHARTPGGNETDKALNEKRAAMELERKTRSSPLETPGQWRR